MFMSDIEEVYDEDFECDGEDGPNQMCDKVQSAEQVPSRSGE